MRTVLALAFATLALSPLAWSGDEKPAHPTVAYRHTLFEAAAKHMKMSGMIAKGEIDRPGDMLVHATALQGLSQDLVSLFPAGTGPDQAKTDAKAEIWSKPAQFATAATAFKDATAGLVDAAKTNDKAKFGAALGKVGESCGGCHETFRAEH
jgi:cytochrome c556